MASEPELPSISKSQKPGESSDVKKGQLRSRSKSKLKKKKSSVSTEDITSASSVTQLQSSKDGHENIESQENVSSTSSSKTQSSNQTKTTTEPAVPPPTTTSMLKKFQLLLWKNYVLQKRHKIQTILEVILPLFFLAILVFVRTQIYSLNHPKGEEFYIWRPSDKAETIMDKFEKDGKELYVLYAPNNDPVKKIMDIARDNFFPEKDQKYKLFSFTSEDELLKVYDKPTKFPQGDVLGAVIFQGNTAGDEITYKIRMPATYETIKKRSGTSELAPPRWYTGLTYPDFQLLGPRHGDCFDGGIPGYYSQGFTLIQFAVDVSIIKSADSVDSPVRIAEDSKINDLDLKMRRFPYPAYIDDYFIVALEKQLSLLILLSFIYPFVNITKSIVTEKELKLKESMKMMGLPNYLHWSAWFLKCFLFLFMTVLLMVGELKIKWTEGLSLIQASDSSVLITFLVAYIFSLIMLAFFLSTLFSRGNSSSTGAGAFWFLVYFPYFFIAPNFSTLSRSQKLMYSLLSNTGMAFGWKIILLHEGSSAGAQWSNIATGTSLGDNFSLLDCIMMFFVDGLLYFLLAIYIEGVKPGEFGVPMPWYFPVSKTYWCGHAENIGENAGKNTNTEINPNFEAPPKNLKAGIMIQDLSKTFGKKQAVRNLKLNMYENQITVLLGHNGAGKSTTMSILTGMFPPTSGTAIVNDFDIRKDIRGVRNSLGLCPQHDILFDELTCVEHLRFFCWMKGCKNVNEEIDHIITSIGLEPKRNSKAGTLSGGMRRKLSVGIALCGGSKIVLFDEPTAGMDPGARRLTWDLLTSEKQNRTILLSTHFMDEADLLGDRIAVMANGQLECVGSSLFLKKRYGAGYNLIVVKQPNCDVNKITDLLKKHIGEAEIEQDIGAELSYALPDSKSKLFADMFEEIEKRRTELGIDSYGAGITTMEEVFVRIGKEVEGRKRSTEQRIDVSNDEDIHQKKHEFNSGCSLLCQQFRAILAKRFLYLIRNWILFFILTLLPVAFLALSLKSLQTVSQSVDNPNLMINLDKFGDTVTTLSCQDANDLFCKKYEQVAHDYNTKIRKTTESFSDFILSESRKSIVNVNQRYIIGLEKKLEGKGTTTITAFYNNQPYHGQPIALNFMMNALFRYLTKNNKKRIIVSNHPLPYTAINTINNNDEASGETGFQIGLNISFGMSFLASSYVIFLIKERVCKAKHLQFVSGVRFWIFWVANFMFDFVLYFVPCILLVVVMIPFKPKTFEQGKILANVFLLFVFYGWAVIPFMYLFSFAFNIPASGFARMSMINMFSGLALLLAVTVLQMPNLNLRDTADILDWLFTFSPNYDLGYGILKISTNVMLHDGCPEYNKINKLSEFCPKPEFQKEACCIDYPYDYLNLHPPGLGRNLLFLFMIGLLNFAVLFIIDGKLLACCGTCRARKNQVQPVETTDKTIDSDVAEEANRIQSTDLNKLFKTETLVIKNLGKSYGSFTAVQCLNLGVKKNECFGLLGVNGAGKTTTFKMMTGDFPASSGDAFICGYSVSSDIRNVQKNIGYCPQFDAIIDELTGRETIRLFARLRGIQEKEIDDLVNKLGDSLLFREHIDKPCGPYSGGNKRKLSVAMALVGNPPLVFLDEPSTGMDPVARRNLWDCIAKVRDAGASVVLTSHSMEECEALCTRLVIMVNGQFCCLGSIQHLKTKFGEGYTLIAQMTTKIIPNRKSLQETQKRLSTGIDSGLVPWEVEMQPLRDFIEKAFLGSILKDFHPGYVHYHVTNPDLRWSTLFRKMEEAKVLFKLEAYSVGQTSLEQVFINFAKAQTTDE